MLLEEERHSQLGVEAEVAVHSPTKVGGRELENKAMVGHTPRGHLGSPEEHRIAFEVDSFKLVEYSHRHGTGGDGAELFWLFCDNAYFYVIICNTFSCSTHTSHSSRLQCTHKRTINRLPL